MRQRENKIVEGDISTSPNAASSHNLIRNVITGLIFLFFSQNIFSQFTTPVFEYLSSEDGLPENSVTCILQDHLGYLWLGTQNGLVKYDGYSMQVYVPEKNDSTSISDGYILTIFEDKNNTLWIGTTNGLNKFNRKYETFNCYKNNPKDQKSINSSSIKCLYEDLAGKFWVGTQEGLNLFDRENQAFTKYFFRDSDTITSHNLGVNAIIEEPGTGNLLLGTDAAGLWTFNSSGKTLSKYIFNRPDRTEEKTGRIQSFFKSRDGKIWMASWHTLTCLDLQNKEFKCYMDFPISIKELHFGSITAMGAVIEDRTGLIWSGFNSLDKGIFCLNPGTGVYRQYKLFPEKPEKSNYNNVYSLYEDNSGIIWIGTWLSGLEKWDKRKFKFNLLMSETQNHKKVPSTWLHTLLYDHNGYLWFFTEDALNKYDLSTGNYYNYFKGNEFIPSNAYQIILTKRGDMWIAGLLNGLIKFNPANGSYKVCLNNTNDSLNLSGKKVITLFEDHLGFIWIGTQISGLYRYDPERNELSLMSKNRVNLIFEDSFGTLWIGTNLNGLKKFNRSSEKFTYCGLNTIMGIFEDKNKNFWVGDYFSGLNLFDRDDNQVIASYGQKDGLAHNAIQGIMEDDHNNLWISTELGLSKFSIENRNFKNYTREDGLPDNRFKFNGCCKDADENMYFITEGGLIYFNPDSIRDDPIPPKVVIRNISLFNRSGENLNYEGFISDLKEITVPYNKNDLRFDYVGLHFSASEKNQYKYILENFDGDWVNAGTQRNATYTNLDPGKYIFRVKAANKDGTWSKTAASITITITPPWWKTIYAYILYTLIIISIIYLTLKLQLRRTRKKHEYEMSRFEAEKLHEVDELKTRFFTNISHEFRTPLTLILGPVQQMIEKVNSSKMKDDLTVVYRNADKLLGLVNQLLDIAKIESGSMKLVTIPLNIIPVVKSLVMQFSSYAERKRIDLELSAAEEEIIVYADQEKIEKIITNILSNAFKFTPEDGQIEVLINRSEITETTMPAGRQVGNDINKFVEISIRDTGIGIPKEKIPKIFDRFYQVNGGHKREQEGTGIGLSLTKELIELHKGKITIESMEGKGTTVKISIPLGKEHLKPEEICEEKMDKNKYEKEQLTIEYVDNGKDIIKNDIDDIRFDTESLPLVLIVEDNPDVRRYISGCLEEDYRIQEAADGEDGLEKALHHIPDLIISDVMMPKMDGFELCNKLKTDERTSHIPIILLTAKATGKDKAEGYETGADDYVMKPFDSNLLGVRIKNLIEQRKRVQKHFKTQGLIDLEKIEITSIDKKFLQKVVDIITENISNSTFNVQSLAEKTAMSYQYVHKKIVALTGEPPVELIRKIRLKRALELIEKKFGNISEIALEVGFNNPAYFSKCFKNQFGLSPSEYLHKDLTD